MRRFLSCSVFAVLSLGSVASWALPSGFSKSRVASGLSKPTSMAFAPDGRIFVTERGTTAGGVGRVRVIKNGTLLSAPFASINVDNTTVNPNERGLLGLAFDPNFASNHFVYVYYTAPGSPIHNRISRLTANGDVAVAGSETQLLNLDSLGPGVHNGGALHFGLDGKLYVGVGENRTPANSTNLGNHLGKILRINTNGSAPSDNPFFNSGDGINARDRIWAFGLRNPFTFAVHPTSGRIFVNDVGEATWEEIDDIVKGKDYGWRGGTTDGDGTAWFKYDHNNGKSIAGGTFYVPQTPPGNYASFVGRYFFADYVSGWIRAIDTSTKAVSTFETGIMGPVDLDVGPDGNLYYLSHTAGEIWKITSTSSAQQAIVLSSNRIQVNEGTTGSFTVKLATQPSANVTVNVARTVGSSTITFTPSSLTFTSSNWNSSQNVTVTAAQDADAISQSASLTCSSSGLASQRIAVDNVDNDGNAPKAIISLPNEGDTVRGTSAEYFGGSNLDGSTAQGQFFVDGTLVFTDVGPGHYHFGGSHAAWNTTALSEGGHTLKLAVLDSAGNTGAHQIDVTVDNLPSPWNHLDIGAVGASGTARHSSGTFTVEGAGADVWGTADEFQFVRKKLSGDGEIKARVASIENTDTWAKAGVMIRETLTAGSKHAFMLISGGGASAFQRRTATGGSSASTSGSAGAAPRWVRVTRAGSTLTGFVSSDGTNWTQVGTASITMTTDVFLGLAVTSHRDGTLCTGVFSNVSTVGTTSFVDPDDDVGDPDPTISSTSDGDDQGLRSGCGARISRGTGSPPRGAFAALVAAVAVAVRRIGSAAARRGRSRSGNSRGLPRGA